MFQTEAPITILLKKKHTDWKQMVWWEGICPFESFSLPVMLYLDGPDTLHSGQECQFLNPKIQLRTRDITPGLSVYETSKTVSRCSRKYTINGADFLEKVREEIRGILLKDSDIRSGFIACGLFLGEKSMIPEPIKNKINRAGISHLFAVSGLHVGFIVMLISFILKKCGCTTRVILWLIPVFALFYALLTPFSSSIFRTVLMVTLYSAVTLLKRKVHILQIVFSSMLIMVLYDTSQMNEVGFWFSYLAVLGILLFYPPMERKTRRFPTYIRYILNSLGVSAAATWGIMPAGITVFGTFSTLAIALNLVMIPLVFLMLASIISGVLLHALPGLGSLSSVVYSYLSDVFFFILNRVTQYDDLLVHQVLDAPLVLVFWLIITLLFFNYPRKKVHKYWIFSALLITVFILPRLWNQSVLISGEDNSLILRKGKKVLMINGTTQDHFDQKILKRFRLSGLDVERLLITHPDYINPENVLRFKKRYPGTVVMASHDLHGLADVTIRQDTTVTHGKTSISLFPDHHKINVLLKLGNKSCGLMEYAEKMDRADLIISRKKYSELRTGTNKFLTVRQLLVRDTIKAELKKSGLEAEFNIW
ncbi:MAG: ComEC/Rec2 family competence protein [Fidelibacterota bacterium]